jgi:alpha-beta hydrolase superfamily lysophospholipase
MAYPSVNTSDDRIKGAGGLQLFVRSWRPNGKARAVVAIIPGFNSHSAYYTWAGEQLASNGLATYAVDLHGRGLSDGERFYVEKFADYVTDAAALVNHVKDHEPELPVFMLGHSAGGVVACTYTLDHPGELAGLICQSFAHEIPAPDFVLAVFKGVSHLAPHAHIFHLKNEIFSRDPKAVEAMNNDPLIAHETQPTKTLAEMVRADERLKKEFPLITLPVLIMHGTADQATKPSGSRRFFEMAGSQNKALKLYEGYFHDLLNDVGKDLVMADIRSWIDEHLPTVSKRTAV